MIRGRESGQECGITLHVTTEKETMNLKAWRGMWKVLE